MNMKVLFKVVVILLATIVAGCAANGSHDYYNGKCVTCRNDFMAGEMLDYESKGTNNYTQLSWRELMFEGLARNGDTDMLPYGEDYLKHRIGNKAISLQSNEIAYRREIVKSSSELDASLAQHSLKKAYQITLSSQLGAYDFVRKEFPLRFAKSFAFTGGNNIKILPRKIAVNVGNFTEIPNFKISPEDAENFLNARNNSRGVYVRYIVEITKMISPSLFESRVREVQFIDVKPSIVSNTDKEKYQPFRSVKM